MLFIRDIELCCDCRFARLEIEFDIWGSDLYLRALFQGNKLDKVTYLEGATDNIVDGGRLQ